MPIRAQRLIRKMRGGAQAHLLQADDGKFYVVKFRNNPQHRRVLINEWIASVFLKQLQISTPEAMLIEITPQFLEAEPEVYMQLGNRRLGVEPGWHFGSQFPGDPNLVPVFDFLPDSLLTQCVNLRDYLGVLVFDKWVSNADGRQSIFYKARIRDSRGEPVLEKGFVTQMMDNGFIFDGPNWQYGDSPIQGHYFRAQVYAAATRLEDFQPWLDRVRYFPEEVMDDARKRIPLQWLEDDGHLLDGLLERLLKRRDRVVDLLEAARRAKSNLFLNWH
jgi:hypothetical protein